MNATIISNNEKHYPVLLDEILSIISPQNGGTFIDCTFGQGGYSQSILKFSKTKVIANFPKIYMSWGPTGRFRENTKIC